MFEFEREDYILGDNKYTECYKEIQQTREEVLKEALDVYLRHQHSYTLKYILDLQSRMHNVKLKHFYAYEYTRDNKTHYTFKGDLIFTIYFDNMQWKCDMYY